MLHVFITKDHFRKCHEAALYGVRPSSVNQLAQVRDGDAAYFYHRLAGALYGPYTCRGEIKYLGPEVAAPVWEPAAPGSRKEKFRFVVRVEVSTEINRIGATSFRRLALAAGAAVDVADFVKRSVFTFLPADGRRMLGALGAAAAQRPLPYLSRSRPLPLDGLRPVNLAHLPYLLRHERLDESLLEFLLARETTELAEMLEAAPAFNQLRTDARGNRIDLLYASAASLFVVELKMGRRDAEARRDILRYELWARGRRRHLAARLGLAAAEPAVAPVLVAAGGPARPEGCRVFDWRLDRGRDRFVFSRVQ